MMRSARTSLTAAVKNAFIVALIAGVAFIASATMQGQRSKAFTCDTDNGGLTLPAGFCAGVIADNLGTARNLVVAPNGDIFVSVRSGPTVQGQPPPAGFILGLRDTNGDGKIDMQEQFGTQGATGIRLRNGYLYYSTPTSIERFKMAPGELKPSGPAEVIVGDFPSGPNFYVTNAAGVSNQGLVEDGFIQLTGGAHSIVATFTSSDLNYQNSTSNTLSVTITPAATTTLVASSLGVVPSGSPVTLTAVVGSNSNSVQGPTGTIQFQSGSTNLGAPVACTPSGANANGGASCLAQLTTTVSALYPPTLRDPRPTLPLLPLLFALLSVVLYALGWRWMPEKRRRTYAYAGFLAFALLAVAIAGCGGGGGGSGKTVTIKASYVGDTNYAASSGTTKITVQ